MTAGRLVLWGWVTAPVLILVGSVAMRFTSPAVGLAIGAAVWAAAAYGMARKTK